MIMITVDRARRVEQYKCVKLWMDHHLPIQTIYSLIIRHLSSQLTLANETKAWIRHADCVEHNRCSTKIPLKNDVILWKINCNTSVFRFEKSIFIYVLCPDTCRVWKLQPLMFLVYIVFYLVCNTYYVYHQKGELICLCCLYYLKHQCRSCATPLSHFKLRTA